jgi:hypothetical protein
MPRKFGHALLSRKARRPSTHHGALPEEQYVQPQSLVFAFGILGSYVAVALLPLDGQIQSHRVVVHGGICDKSPRKLVWFVMNVKLT